VRIVSPFIGGAFGSKGFTWQHDLLAAVAAKVVGRPVKLVLTRHQMATLAGHRPETIQVLALGAAKDGRLTAVRHATTSTTSPLADFVEPCGTLTKHMYSCPSVAVSHRVVRVNRSSPVFTRAPGELPGTFALESAMDELAEKLGLDPVELRLKNHADRDEEKDLPWSSNHLKECYRRGAERFGWAKRAAKPRATRDGKWLVGSGMATSAYPGVRGEAKATVRLRVDGTAVAASSGHEIGNGAYTVLAQVAADALGLPADRVKFELGDSALPFAPAAGASQTTATIGTAVINAAREVKAKLAALATADQASPLFGVAADQTALRGGKLVSTADETKAEPVAALLRRAGRDEIEAEGASAPPKAKEFAVMSFGAQFCEVQVDADLGTVRVARVVGVFDPGRILSPKAARSQLVGGIVWGLGAALLEQTVYDPRTGQPVTADLADYLVPVHADVPPINVSFIDEPDYRFNPTGGRGLGELGITGIAAAVANAVYHATGKRVRRLPITCDQLL
jgi:xanthine dehydrogenase YagR molybdenum-binding subunit